MKGCRPLFAFLLLVLLPSTGCLHLSLPKTPRPAEPLPASALSQFVISGDTTFTSSETTIEIQPRYTLLRVELVPAHDSPLTNIYLDYYRLPRDKSPVIVLLPISGGHYEPESIFARYFVRRGFAVLLVRRREFSNQTPTLEAVNAGLKEPVTVNKTVLDWIQTRPELDAERIGLFGISVGGIQGALLASLDQRISAAALGLTGGDLPFVLARSTEKGISKPRAAFLREHNMGLDEFEAGLRKTITCDPILCAQYADPEKILLVLAMCDRVVPFKKGWELRQGMGRPETVLLPTGHYTAALCIPYVERTCLRFFRKHLKTP